MKNPILQYMKKHKMTEKELAEKCGLSVYILRNLIDCRRSKTTYLYKLCLTTRISADDYLKYYLETTKKGTRPLIQ